ncbi:MAG TPA: hypothetical protein VFI43_00085 [Nitrosospira sp.]|nr:hypothetical protein [Nitrosospira sp.]
MAWAVGILSAKKLFVGLQIGKKGLQINEHRMQIAFSGDLPMRYALLPLDDLKLQAARYDSLLVTDCAWIFWGVRHA